MEIPAPSILFSLFVIVLILHLPHTSMAEPRSQIVQIICGTQLLFNNAMVSLPNFVVVMETISQQMRNRGYGVAVSGTGPDTNYGLAQCYGDLSLLDCVLCYAEARTNLPRCFPYNGGRIYLDGCFIRAENYTFNDQYLGPEDRHVCGNRMTKGTLDLRLRAKIADFGLARSFQEGKSHISTAIAGTLGYMAPEYLARGQLTEKADVYSFEVLLFEIVTGRQNNKRENAEYAVSLVSEVWGHFQHGIVEELLDPNLMLHNCHTINVKNEVARVLHVGLLCTQEIPILRPSMSKALQMLVKKDEELPPPTKPPFVDEKTMELHDPCEKYSPKQRVSATIAILSDSSFYPR